MGHALARLAEEDHTLPVRRDQTPARPSSPVCVLHLDVSLEKLKRKFGTELTTQRAEGALQGDGDGQD